MWYPQNAEKWVFFETKTFLRQRFMNQTRDECVFSWTHTTTYTHKRTHSIQLELCTLVLILNNIAQSPLFVHSHTFCILLTIRSPYRRGVCAIAIHGCLTVHYQWPFVHTISLHISPKIPKILQPVRTRYCGRYGHRSPRGTGPMGHPSRALVQTFTSKSCIRFEAYISQHYSSFGNVFVHF